MLNNHPIFVDPNSTAIVQEKNIRPELFAQGNFLVVGNALSALKTFPDKVINTVVTSPPYYGQRDYAVEGQLGSEKSPEEYIESLVEIFDEVKRVLADDGTIWLNLGDKYINHELHGLPWRVALRLKERGWKLRSDIIWHKPNAMPSPVKNRPTTSHEYIFMFSKRNRYYYDADSIREPHITFTDKSRMRGGRSHFGKRGGTPETGKNAGNPNLHNSRWDQAFHPDGRNKRTVWEVPLSKFRDAHFAVFPESLIRPCILAGAPGGGIVLDPFFGSGTTGKVALENDRKFIGIDINKDYCEIARKRLIP